MDSYISLPNLSVLACVMYEISGEFSHMQVLIPGDTDTTYWCTVRSLPSVAQEEEIFLYKVRAQLGAILFGIYMHAKNACFK